VYSPPRRSARIVPPSPMTVAIEDETGFVLGYGVIANISESGACVWTDGILARSMRLMLRVSFGRLSEVHEIDGVVIWEGVENRIPGSTVRRFGIEWCDASPACIGRLRELALQAADARVTPSGRLVPIQPTTGH
jgi:hypothetical protein